MAKTPTKSRKRRRNDADDALIQCACAVGQGIGPIPFDDEAGRAAADFFREQIGAAKSWPRDRKRALHWARYLGEYVALSVRARNGSSVRLPDLQRGLEAVLKALGNCPLSP